LSTRFRLRLSYWSHYTSRIIFYFVHFIFLLLFCIDVDSIFDSRKLYRKKSNDYASLMLFMVIEYLFHKNKLYFSSYSLCYYLILWIFYIYLVVKHIIFVVWHFLIFFFIIDLFWYFQMFVFLSVCPFI